MHDHDPITRPADESRPAAPLRYVDRRRRAHRWTRPTPTVTTRPRRFWRWNATSRSSSARPGPSGSGRLATKPHGGGRHGRMADRCAMMICSTPIGRTSAPWNRRTWQPAAIVNGPCSTVATRCGGPWPCQRGGADSWTFCARTAPPPIRWPESRSTTTGRSRSAGASRLPKRSFSRHAGARTRPPAKSAPGVSPDRVSLSRSRNRRFRRQS